VSAPASTAETTTFQPVIGLEVHVQLDTLSKLFCACPAAFEAPPNSQVCPVCAGLPGALPVLNERAVELAVRAAAATGCVVHEHSTFARKGYHYPGLPKGYQITQHERPLATRGSLPLGDGEDGDGDVRTVRIRSIHLEEDSGRLLHDRTPGTTAIDLNRAGIPLVEIVTEPDLGSPAEARAFLIRLRQLLEYLEVTTARMEEGVMRVDANLSLREAGGDEPGERTEIKNLNSFSAVERALSAEAERQAALVREGGAARRQTLRWDDAAAVAIPLRNKQEASGYRYIPEPNLPPVRISAERVREIQEALPVLPAERARGLRDRHGIPREHAAVLTRTRELADYYEEVVAADADPSDAASWVMTDLLSALAERGETPETVPVRPADLASLLMLVGEGKVTRAAAREAFGRMLESGEPAAQVIGESDLLRVGDAEVVMGWVEEAVRSHPEEVARYRAGEERLLDFFIGRVMHAAGGRADPAQAEAYLRERLDA
jgi:aspartyl-tRNA(Asn)/glutamyl-tRNA(Gln) amidotransferase subunit B